MAPRAIWKGTINVGLVFVPVKLYSAVRTKDVRFNELHAVDGARLKHQRLPGQEEEEVPFDEIVRGFEIAPDQYVVIEPEEIEAAAPPSTRTVQIDRFVDADAVDPIFSRRATTSAPTRAATRRSRCSPRALTRPARSGSARSCCARRSTWPASARRATACAVDDALLRRGRRAREPRGRARDRIELRDRELAIANQLVDSLSSDFEHDEVPGPLPRAGHGADPGEGRGQGDRALPARGARATDDLLAALEASLRRGARAEEGEGLAQLQSWNTTSVTNVPMTPP